MPGSDITAPEWIQTITRESDRKLDRLKNIKPVLLDVSLREPAVGSPVGQTLQSKLALFPKLRQFGFENIILGSLNYALPNHLQVDDDFMIRLRNIGADLTGCFALTDPGHVDAGGAYVPSPSQEKLRQYGVPNTVHEIYLADGGLLVPFDLATFKRDLLASLAWMRANIRGENGNPPRVILNIVDGCDAFAVNLPRVCAVLQFVASLPLEAVSIEDDRGTYMPFQVGAFVAIAKGLLPAEMKLLVHIHGGAGFENASAIEALLNGADGLWGALAKRTAVNGHASTGELIANLVRVGNEAMNDYRVRDLLPLARHIQEAADCQPVPDDLPILKRNAYRLPLSFFRQRAERPMDLAPEVIGGQYRFRICPVVSDAAVIAGRLAEVTGRPVDAYPANVLTCMISMMRQSLRQGFQIRYDDPDELRALHRRASALCAATSTDQPSLPAFLTAA